MSESKHLVKGFMRQKYRNGNKFTVFRWAWCQQRNKRKRQCITVTVRNGKGGHGGEITCRQDPYLYDRLQDYVSRVQATQGEKLFYSEATMRKEAGRLGMECHDLRRIYAILSRRELKAVMPAAQADREVQRSMRHVRFSTTKRYLYNRKLRMD